MRSLNVPEVAPCFGRLVATTDWRVLDLVCRREQRGVLLENQAYRCAWCERSIELASSHIDHVKSRGLEPNRTFDHSNIVASCGSVGGVHCGHARSRNSLPDEVNLYLVVDIQKHFRVQADGTLVVERGGLSAVAHASMEGAINDELNLNCGVLKSKRMRRFAELNSSLSGGLTAADLLEVYSGLDFLSLAEQVCRN